MLPAHLPVAQQRQAVDAEIGIDPGLGGDGADARLDEGADAADGRNRGRDRDTQHAGARASGRNRKGIELKHPLPP